MKLIENQYQAAPSLAERILASCGHGPFAAAARSILEHQPGVAIQEIARLAEEIHGTDPTEGARRQRLLLICRLLIVEAKASFVTTEVHEGLFDTLLYVAVGELTENCARLMAHLLDTRRAEYAPLLERYLSSRLDTDRVFAVRAILRVRRMTGNDVNRLLRASKDPSPRIVSACNGALFCIFRGANDGQRQVAEVVASAAVPMLAPILVPDNIFEETRFPWFPMSGTLAWHGYARSIRKTIQKRLLETPAPERAELIALARLVSRRSIGITVLHCTTVTLAFVLLRVYQLLGGQVESQLTSWEFAVLEGFFFFLGAILVTLLGGRLLHLLWPAFRYRTLSPSDHILSIMALGRANDRLTEDIAGLARGSVRLQRRLITMALDDNESAKAALAIILQHGTISTEVFIASCYCENTSSHERERTVDLLAFLCTVPRGRILAHDVVTARWQTLAECSNLPTLLESNVPLVPPLLHHALERLKQAPLENYRLLMQVCVEAPQTFPTYQRSLFAGMGYLFYEGACYPEVIFHFLQLYPNEVYRALVDGYRHARRDADARHSFNDSIERESIKTFFTTTGAYRLSRAPELLDRVRIAILVRHLNEDPDKALEHLLELASIGLPSHLFTLLTSSIQNHEARAPSKLIAELLRCRAAEDLPETLIELLAASEEMPNHDTAHAFAVVRAIAKVLETTFSEDLSEAVTAVTGILKQESSATNYVRSLLEPLEEILTRLNWTLDAKETASYGTLLLSLNRLVLDLQQVLVNHVPRPFRDLTAVLARHLQRNVSKELGLRHDLDTTDVSASLSSPSSTNANLPISSHGYLGEATQLLRQFWAIVAPIVEVRSPSAAPTETEPDLAAIHNALGVLERSDWTEITGVWPSWTVDLDERERAAAYLEHAVHYLTTCSRPEVRLPILLAMAATPSKSARAMLFPLTTRLFSKEPALAEAFYNQLLQSVGSESPQFIRSIEMLHHTLLIPSMARDTEIKLAIASFLPIQTPTGLEQHSLACLGRLARSHEPAWSVIQRLAEEEGGLVALPALTELFDERDRARSLALRILRRTGLSHAKGALFPALILFSPPGDLRSYRRWLTALFHTTRKLGEAVRRGSDDARELLDDLAHGEHGKISFAAIVELATVEIETADDPAGVIEKWFLHLKTLETTEADHLLLATLFRRTPHIAWAATQQAFERGFLSLEKVIAGLKESLPCGVTSAIDFLNDHIDYLKTIDHATILQLAYALADGGTEAIELFEQLVDIAPKLLTHPTHEALWRTAVRAAPDSIRSLVQRIEATRHMGVPLRHCAALLSAVAPDDSDWHAHVADLATRVGGLALVHTAMACAQQPERLETLKAILGSRRSRSEDRRGALAALAKASPSNEAARNHCQCLLSSPSVITREREELVRELVAALPASPTAIMPLIRQAWRQGIYTNLRTAIIGLIATNAPGLAWDCLLEDWDHHIASALRHTTPTTSLELVAHLSLLMGRGRMGGYSHALEKCGVTRAQLETIVPAHERSTSSNLHALLSTIDFVVDLTGPGDISPPYGGYGNTGPPYGRLALRPIFSTLRVLRDLIASSHDAPSQCWRGVLADMADRLAQDVVSNDLATLPGPFSPPLVWLVERLDERLQRIRADYSRDTGVDISVLGIEKAINAQWLVHLQLKSIDCHPVRKLHLSCGLATAPPITQLHHRVLRANEQLFVTIRLPELSAMEGDRIEVRLDFDFLPGVPGTTRVIHAKIENATTKELQRLHNQLIQHWTALSHPWQLLLQPAIEQTSSVEDTIDSFRKKTPQLLEQLTASLDDNGLQLLELLGNLETEGRRIRIETLRARCRHQAPELVDSLDSTIGSLISAKVIKRERDVIAFLCPASARWFAQELPRSPLPPVTTAPAPKKVTPFPSHRLR